MPGRSAGLFLERVADAFMRNLPRGRKAKEKSRENCGGAEKCENHGIRMSIAQERHGIELRLRNRGDEQRSDPLRGQKTKHASGCGEDHAFREELRNQPAAAGTQRRANGEFPSASRGADHQQIGHVGASDQQNESHGAEKNQQKRLDLPDDAVAQRNHEHLNAAVLLWVGGGQARVDGIHFRAGLRGRDAGRQAAESPASSAGCGVPPYRPEMQRHPDFGIARGCEFKFTRQHADDANAVGIELQRLADDVRVAGQSAFSRNGR